MVNAQLNAARRLAEVLLIVALSEIVVMLSLPVLAPNASRINGALIDVGLLVSLSAPWVYWRLTQSPANPLADVANARYFGIQSRPILWAVITTLLAGLVLTGACVVWQQLALERVAQGRFDQGADRITAEVLQRLKQSFNGLKGARGVIGANPQLKRKDFRAYVESRDLPSDYPGVRGIGLIQRVPRTEQINFIASQRRDEAPEFNVQTAGAEPDLYVVKYVEPQASNSAALGIDLGQESTQRNAIERAIGTGQPTLLANTSLLQDGSWSAGFMFFVPVYRNGVNLENASARERNLLGLVYAPVAASELLATATAINDRQIDFELFDGAVADVQRLLFDADRVPSVSAPNLGPPPKRKHASQRTFQMGGTDLTIRLSSTARFESAQDRSSLIIIGAGGTLMSLLMAWSVWLLASGQQRARSLALSMTDELNRMAQVVQHTSNAVSIMDRAMRIVWINPGYTTITGFSFEEARGRTPTELLSSGKSDQGAINSLIEGANQGSACRVQLINRAKDGHEYWADTEVQPMRSTKGELIGFMEIGADISEQKRTQQRLETAIRESRALLDTVEIHAIVSVTDSAGVILEANDGFLKISGYPLDELIGKSHNIVNSGRHSREFWDEFWGAISSGKPWRGEICNRAKDGRLYWVDSMIAPFIGNDGFIEKYISIRTDISARKQAELALSLSNALMEESQAVANVGGWELNLETGNLYWTRETYRIHETSPEEFNPTVDAGVGYFLPESRDRISAALQLAVHTGEGYDLELQTLTTKGRLITVRTTCKASTENGKVVRLSGIFQDITDRKRYELSLEEARDKAELATRGKAQFLANMSHEIRTPMNAILGMLSLLQKTGLNNRQLDYANKTEAAAKSLLGLINDILDFSKVEAGKMGLDAHPFRMDELMRNMAVILSSNLGAKPVQVLFDIDARLPAVVMGDAMRLQQVLINLGGNAVKFTLEGQVILSVQLVELTNDMATLNFAVSDSGIGIAPEHQQHIFDGFSQAEASTTRKFGGTGLGLAISKRLVELMGGNLQLNSELDKGSVFYFQLQLPVVSVVGHRLPAIAPTASALQRALVVDANPSALKLVGSMVQSWGWSIDIASNCASAMEIIKAQLKPEKFPFDVIFTAWDLPGHDGWELTKWTRKFCTRIQLEQPVIVMMGSNSRETLERRSLEEQQLLNGFLLKPVTASMLLDAAMHGSSAAADRGRRDSPAASQRRLLGMRILVVEDNLINQQVAEELLSAEGANVSLAANGQLGVNAIEAAAAGRQFDAVLMDIQMPVMDGFAATRVIRETLRFKDLRIIAMTANAMSSDREECLASGMNEHIGKPFDMNGLVEVLLRVTGYQGQLDALPASEKPSLDSRELWNPTGEPPSVDFQTAIARMGGNTSLYMRTASEFARTLPAHITEMASQTSEESKQLAILAHTLKGTAATLGANALSTTAATIERLCKTGKGRSELAVAIGKLREAASETLNALHREIDATDPPRTDIAASRASEVFRREAALAAANTLFALLEQSDLKALERFAECREALNYAPEAMFDALENAMQGLDLGTALTICKEIQAWIRSAADSNEEPLP
jgi:PAS domain S-box-containing protein